MKRTGFEYVLSFALILAACGGSGGAGVSDGDSVPSGGSSPAPTQTSSSGYGNSVAQVCPQGAPTTSGTLNCTALPLGDRKYSTTTPQVGYIYDCHTESGSPVVSSAPWLSASTWNALTKLAVEGSNAWAGTFSETSNGTTRTISGDDEPITPVTTGTFPISPSDPAYEYDQNPNSIESHPYTFTVASNPTAASSPTCLSGGAIGVTLDGVAIYDAFDAAGYDAVARELQDPCHGHPDQSDVYHYHGFLQACVTDAGSATQNSSLLGYAADGYGIYGPWYNGKVLETTDLDECHGTTSAVMWDGKLVTMYHYVSTYDFPYTLGCYHGTPTSIGIP